MTQLLGAGRMPRTVASVLGAPLHRPHGTSSLQGCACYGVWVKQHVAAARQVASGNPVGNKVRQAPTSRGLGTTALSCKHNDMPAAEYRPVRHCKQGAHKEGGVGGG